MMLVIYGPTAVGKTSFALKLAKKFNAEIISADSRQVYSGLDIGSGKVSFKNKVKKNNGFWTVDGTQINGFDLISPDQEWSVANFLVYATKQSERISSEKKIAIVVGGTGFYLHSLLYGLDSIGIPADTLLRKSLERMTLNQLFAKLKTVDPKRAFLLNESDKKNPRRIIRAIEISSSRYKNKKSKAQFTKNDLLIGLNANNEYLYKKSDRWLDERLKNGLLQEIEALISKGIDIKWLESLGLEYRWLTKFILNKITYDEAHERLKGDTHSFIRRQKTWFKKFPHIKLFNVEPDDGFKNAEKEVLTWVNTKKSF